MPKLVYEAQKSIYRNSGEDLGEIVRQFYTDQQNTHPEFKGMHWTVTTYTAYDKPVALHLEVFDLNEYSYIPSAGVIFWFLAWAFIIVWAIHG
jgi:hypothetical protein